METFEYKCQSMASELSDATMSNSLNLLANQGWKLKQVIPDPSQPLCLIMVMERPFVKTPKISNILDKVELKDLKIC